jgi:peptide/nickel transport system permease protein
MVPVVFGVLFVVFTIMYLTPGDPATLTLGEQAAPEAVAQLRAEWGLDRPFLIQFFNFVGRAVRLDFGMSYSNRMPVFGELMVRFPHTFRLAGLTVLLAALVGIPLGILCAVKHHTIFDSSTSILGLVMLSVPNFWLGLMLILFFSVRLGLLPVSGFDTPAHWVMPMLTLGLSAAGSYMRFTRSSMLEVIRQDYIRTARAKGQKESVVIFKHALKNALIPVITVMGLSFGVLLGGAVLTETVFAINGIGRFLVESIRRQDFPIVQGGVLVIAFAFSFINLFVDIIYGFVDPRIRSQYK